MKMKMKALLVACFLIAQVLLVLADEKANDTSKASDVKKRENAEIGEIDPAAEEKSPEAQRKRDHGYYLGRPSHPLHGRRPGYRRPNHQGRIVTRLQSQINRPFKQYGPPSSESQGFNHDQPAAVSLVNQDAPEPLRQTSFAPESPIASQNSQPFGQHTANYLPPRNQKLPASNPPYQFSTHEFLDNQQFKQQQQQQHYPEQNQQLQVDNQHFFNQNFDVQDFGQNNYQSQQISDAALFLSQNAQAISNLYGAPAPDQNYAPINQDFEPVNQQLQPQQQQQQQQHNQFSQNLQIGINDQPSRFPNQLPSYASGVLDNQETLEKIQSLEKDRLIAQLQHALSSRENAARFEQSNSLPITQFHPADASYNHHGTSYPLTSTTATSSLGFQGYYTTSPAPTPTTTQAPVQRPSTQIPVTTSTLQPGGSEAGSSQVGSNLPAPPNYRPTFTYPQYNGFVPTFVSSSGFIPSSPSFGAALYPTLIKPVETSPTHFAIPIPSLDVPKPAQPATPTTPATTRPPNNQQPQSTPPNFLPSRPGTPTFSIPLGPVHSPPVQASPPVQPVKPVVPVLPAGTPVHPTYGFHPAATPVHPTYGLHPAATPVHPTYGLYPTLVNPSFVYKPVKAYPVYYYPGAYRKPIVTSPWNYAPSYTRAEIWK